VGDRREDMGDDLLTEREREALQDLARAMVREVGLQRDPDAEVARDGMKVYLDVFKHLGTLSGASALVVAALYETLDIPLFLTAITLISLSASFLAALVGLLRTTKNLSMPSLPDDRRALWWAAYFSGALLVAGILTFTGFSLYLAFL
jgi:hypothetical protein